MAALTGRLEGTACLRRVLEPVGIAREAARKKRPPLWGTGSRDQQVTLSQCRSHDGRGRRALSWLGQGILQTQLNFFRES